MFNDRCRVALSVIQRNIRRWMAMRNWQWWKLYTRVKPLLTMAKADDELKKQAEEYEETKKELEKVMKRMKELEEQNELILREKNDLFDQMQAGDSTVGDLEEKCALLINQKGEQDEELKDLEERLKDLEGGSEAMTAKLDKKNDEISNFKKNVESLELNLQKVKNNRFSIVFSYCALQFSFF
jgi:chromosome segregation ATPase